MPGAAGCRGVASRDRDACAGRAAEARAGILVVACAVLLGCGAVTQAILPDGPVPVTLRAAVEPARAALRAAWDRPEPVAFRFLRARCALGAGVVMVYQQLAPGAPPTHALVLSHDIAAGIIAGGWTVRFDVPDPETDAAALARIGDRGIACP